MRSWTEAKWVSAHFAFGMLFTAVMGAPVWVAIYTVETSGGPVSAIAGTVSFGLTFAAIMLFGMGVDEAEGEVTLDLQGTRGDSTPVGEWLREEFHSDIERWRSTSARGWALTGVETVFTVGLAFRAFLHLFVLGLVDEPGDVEWGLSLTPVDDVDAAVVTDVRWLVAGVGLLMVGYGRGLPPVAAAVWVLQALPLLADFAISLDEDLNIGVAARLGAAAAHSQAQDGQAHPSD